MKGFYVDNYSKITIAFWVVFIVLLWLQYIYLSTLIEATLFLIVLIPAVILSYLLANK
jgi:two-component system, LytTR family, sensor kinase